MLRGFHIEGGFAKCEGVEAIKANRLHLILKQGLKRQIRLMLYKLGYEVERLFRIRIGSILIEGLARGAWRFLSQKEIAALRAPAAKKVRSPNPPSPKTGRGTSPRPGASARAPSRPPRSRRDD